MTIQLQEVADVAQACSSQMALPGGEMLKSYERSRISQ